jgi:large subunit ribosomal protein L15
MVVRKERKIRKFRGKRTYGSGSHKKHRGSGSSGGRGSSGMHKHKWSYTVKFAPEHFGKRGFTQPLAVAKKVKAINLWELDKIAKGETKINLAQIGYDKVLGSGKVTKPLVVEAKEFSKNAVKKLEEAGGKAIKV